MISFDCQKTRLSNGLLVLTHHISTINSVAIEAVVRAGPRHESKENTGMAHFLEHMLFEGTKRFPTSKELATHLENAGGISSAWTSKENVVYYVKMPKWHLAVAFEYLSEILFNSILSKEAVEKEKKIIQEELNRRNDNVEVQIFDEWFEWTWGKDQTLGRSIIGSKETINKVTKAKLKSYLDLYYQPGNMVLGIAGNFNPKDVLNYCHKYFGHRSSNKKIVNFKKALFTPKDKTVQIIQRKTQQAYLVLGFVTGVHYLHADRFPLRIIADILSLGVSSRLFHRLVYESGLAYSTGAQNWNFTDTGFLYVYGGFSPDKITEAIDVILEELRKLKAESISKEELENVKGKDKAAMSFNLETPEAIADYLSTSQLLENRVLTPQQVETEINKVTQYNVQAISKKYFNRKHLAVTIIGPIDKRESSKIEGAFKLLD
ncbi:insulinase family protein [Candidatus Curtissbacteria bacterium]|nr:insulinase family protein [Candidatus Curtissbacteria bacterium]